MSMTFDEIDDLRRRTNAEAGFTEDETLSERIIQGWFSGCPASDLVRLADAAPELLEIAKSALNHLEGWHSGEFGLEKEAARAAIAKAEGK